MSTKGKGPGGQPLVETPSGLQVRDEGLKQPTCGHTVQAQHEAHQRRLPVGTRPCHELFTGLCPAWSVAAGPCAHLPSP